MIEFFKIILYQPLLNLLVLIYNLIPGHDLGVAIILLTLLIKICLLPLSWQSLKGRKAMEGLQPKLAEIKKKYPGQKDKQAKATMELYKQNKVNPFASCLPLLIQLPILIAVFQVFRTGLNSDSLSIYSFIHNPGSLNALSFGFLNLAKPNYILAGVTALIQFFQSKSMPTPEIDPQAKGSEGAKDESTMSMVNKQMKYMLPLMTLIIGATLPAGIMLYWLASVLISFVEQKISFGFKKKKTEIQIEDKKE